MNRLPIPAPAGCREPPWAEHWLVFFAKGSSWIWGFRILDDVGERGVLEDFAAALRTSKNIW